jgi:YD repeat-containing protein
VSPGLGVLSGNPTETGTGSRLTAWCRADGTEAVFGYEKGLLVEVRETGKLSVKYSWQENPGADRGDSKWPALVHVSADNTHDYTYDLTSKGVVLGVRTRTTGKTTTSVFNPLRRRIEQCTDGATYLVVFSEATAAYGALERIESEGEVLEAYGYDERGQLIGVKRKGEPERVLTYDENGRLLALDDATSK